MFRGAPNLYRLYRVPMGRIADLAQYGAPTLCGNPAARIMT
jgi:hypothetical protein